MLNTHYVSILYESTIKDHRMFNKYIKDDYPWAYEKPKLFERMLITPVCYTIKQLDLMLNEQLVRKEKGELKTLIFDSGGFQIMTRPGYNLKRLVSENLYLYTKYKDIEPLLVMPDYPSPPEDSLEVMEIKLQETIDATLLLFSKLDSDSKTRSLPVFHARSVEHIERQCEIYGEILSASNKACYAIGGTNKKLDIRHIRNIRRLKEIYPDLYLHLLGVASPGATWIMDRIGINSYDAITPHRIATLGMIQTYTQRIYYSDNVDRHDNLGEIKQKLLKHKCPFCDDLSKLRSNTNYRRFHNYIVYDELKHFYSQMNSSIYRQFCTGLYSEYSKSLTKELKQMALF